jgi:regulatory protein
MGRPALSLRGRALRLLTQREQSRLELYRKLTPHAESPEQLESVLDRLQQEGWLSEERFAESLVRRRSARFGLRRIEQELQTHRLDPQVSAPVLATLRATERKRALDAWARRFGEAAQDPTERARQQRFLAQRGFTADAIQWVIRQRGERHDDA